LTRWKPGCPAQFRSAKVPSASPLSMTTRKALSAVWRDALPGLTGKLLVQFNDAFRSLHDHAAKHLKLIAQQNRTRQLLHAFKPGGYALLDHNHCGEQAVRLNAQV